jgi:outer membrane receptor for ferric coprogen and ferric-rhodotorulic acid
LYLTNKFEVVREFVVLTFVPQDAYVLASAMLGYQLDKNIKLQFNVDNIFDEKYYEGISHQKYYRR